MIRLLNPDDLRFYLAATLLFIGAIGIVYFVARRLGFDLLRVLHPHEWRVLGKIVLLLTLSVVLAVRLVNAELPPNLFLYGRF
jgi:hypothetical protein